MTDLISPNWAYRLVAMWCTKRATDTRDLKLVKRARTAYRAGPLVEPVNRYVDLLESQIKRNAAEWRALGEEMSKKAQPSL